ncbi:MAG: hypothetical protein KF760_01320 [Candidatus Eremiobacteraeota bacterium]|nr:hypothetical protein [Candidatus Eremiobacteraeota bacterium]MCW5869793.1 hypothetical protein [Candidatus Eremiobacteraeota bacterium]
MSIMLERCKNCGGPLQSRALPCEYCDSLPGPLPSWRIPRDLPRSRVASLGRFRVGDLSYLVHGRLAPGIFLARRDTPLTEMVVLKVGEVRAEWERMRALQRLCAGRFLGRHLPEPVQCALSDSGKRVLVYRWRREFQRTLASYAGRVPAEAGVWLSHRLLEQLHELHELGFQHGNLRAEHMLAHSEAHGLRLCGWSQCRPGQGSDVADGLEAIAGTLVARAPAPLKRLLGNARGSALEVNEELKRVSAAVLGPPKFCPLSQLR